MFRVRNGTRKKEILRERKKCIYIYIEREREGKRKKEILRARKKYREY